MAKASLERPTLWETAFHESGHVMAMIATGEYPQRVHLSDDPASDHSGRTTTWPTVSGPLGAAIRSAEQDGLLTVVLTYSREVIKLLAGEAAHQLAMGLEPDPADLAFPVTELDPEPGDERQLLALVNDLYWQDAYAWVQQLAIVTITILKDRWADVRLLAEALVERGELSQDDIEEIIPPDRPSHLDDLLVKPPLWPAAAPWPPGVPLAEPSRRLHR